MGGRQQSVCVARGICGIFFLIVMLASPVLAVEETRLEGGMTFANVNFIGGELTLMAVPQFHFSTKQMDAKGRGNLPEGISHHIAVSDLRGSCEGWKLSASMTPCQEDPVEPAKDRALLVMRGAAIEPLNCTIGQEPSAQREIILSTDGTVCTILRAERGEGMGVWSVVLMKHQVELVVLPGGANTDTVTIEWMLENAP